MAKDNNLQDFLTDIADAIREKKGTTDKINPQDFATEIANLSSGDDSGSGSGEASNIEYLDVSGMEQAFILAKMAISVKSSDNDGGYIISPYGLFSGSNDIFKAVAIDFSILIYNSDFPTEVNFITLGEFVTNMGMQLDAIPRLTKEQFYNLEA